MSYWIFVVLVLAGTVAALYVPRFRLKKAIAAPFPDEWVAIVERNIAVYTSLPMVLRLQLRNLIKQFLHQKHFSGAGGLEITDEIRVTIAAEACMLLLNRKTNVYPSLRYIIVYPAAFVVDRPQGSAGGVVSEGRKGLLGESWSNGIVILAWDNVLHGSTNFVDGQNVVLHEFAHQLDNESGSTNGAPPLRRNSYKSWARVFSSNFENLRERSRSQKPTVMDKYGATNPAEFFAVATETFFEKPRQLKSKHPELYEELYSFYKVNPVEWE